MKKIALFAFASGLFLASCTRTCDCDLILDNYTNTALGGWVLDYSTTVAQDTCLDAGIIDSTVSGGNAYLMVRRVECP
ncbi:MAG TPA: hypothetical protein DIT65_01230 [Cryomorphaceae bacterium]|nr:hypothetical protein [Cryomorphaceae bacterium]